MGKVIEASVREGRKRMLTAMVDCQGEPLALRFFHFYPSQIKMLTRGNFIRMTGDIKRNLGYPEMIHPRIELISAEETTLFSPAPCSSQIEPIYPLTEGMNNQKIKQFIAAALQYLERQPLPELLPESVLIKFKWGRY